MKSTTKMDLLTKAVFAQAEYSKTSEILKGRNRTTGQWFEQEVLEFIDAIEMRKETAALELCDVLYTGLVHLNANSPVKYSVSHLIHLLYMKVIKEPRDSSELIEEESNE
jgi:phosphoribosyl-ATP pyrophosphohydrolase